MEGRTNNQNRRSQERGTQAISQHRTIEFTQKSKCGEHCLCEEVTPCGTYAEAQQNASRQDGMKSGEKQIVTVNKESATSKLSQYAITSPWHHL